MSGRGRRAAAFVAAALLGGCVSTAPAPAWEARLRGDAVVLLGEVHDSAETHRLRLELLQRVFAGGWRPAIVMEQFDRERQADIDRARRERPADAQHVIDLAGTPARPGGGWNWTFYRPFVALALAHDVPLIAGNLSNADAAKVVRGGFAAVFADPVAVALKLDRPAPADLQAAQEREIDAGHCGALPRELWPRMARAQFARDAVMADLLDRQARHGGVVLLAGNGHVRRDLGVPRWLAVDPGRVFAVGYLEGDGAVPPGVAFDAVVRTGPVERADPCLAFRARPAGG